MNICDTCEHEHNADGTCSCGCTAMTGGTETGTDDAAM